MTYFVFVVVLCCYFLLYFSLEAPPIRRSDETHTQTKSHTIRDNNPTDTDIDSRHCQRPWYCQLSSSLVVVVVVLGVSILEYAR